MIVRSERSVLAALSLQLEISQVLKSPELVVDAPADGCVVVIAIHLRSRQSEYVVRRSTVADHAFGTAGVSPFAVDHRSVGRFDFEVDIQPSLVDESCVRLFVIPTVRVTNPFFVLSVKKTGFDPAA